MPGFANMTTLSVMMSVVPALTRMVFCAPSWKRMMSSKRTSLLMVSVAPDCILKAQSGLVSGVGFL